MEPNEQGLTKEERIMFAILGIILLIAIGVLIINTFSENERRLTDETPIAEEKGQEESNIKESASESDSSLIEDTTDNVTSNIVVSKKTSKPKKTTNIIKKPSKEEKTKEDNEETECDNGTGSTTEPVKLTWEIKSTITKEAYTGDEITIDKMVILSSGEEVEASLTIKKIINGVASIVEINEDKLIVTEGTYIYYYTYNGETKTQSLIVNKYLNLTGIELLSLNEKLEDDSISEEEFIKLKETFNNTQLTIEENTINLNIIKKENNSNQIALLLKLETDYLDETKITIDNPNIILSKENNTWHQSLLQNEIVLWINYNEINESNEIKLNINGINYTFKLNITIKTETDSDKENESVTDDEEKTEDIEVEEDESEEELPPTTEPEIDSNEDITDSPINESVNIIDNNITIETNLSQ